jgi:hypothetical protein
LKFEHPTPNPHEGVGRSELPLFPLLRIYDIRVEEASWSPKLSRCWVWGWRILAAAHAAPSSRSFTFGVLGYQLDFQGCHVRFMAAPLG